MKKGFWVFLILFIAGSTALHAQTKWIAHRSHSGSDESFSINGAGNFGLPGPEVLKRMEKERRERDSANLKIDTMIRIAGDTIKKATVIPSPKKKATKSKRH